MSRTLALSSKEVRADEDGRNHGGCRLCFGRAVWWGVDKADVEFQGKKRTPNFGRIHTQPIGSALHRPELKKKNQKKAMSRRLSCYLTGSLRNNAVSLSSWNFIPKGERYLVTSFKPYRGEMC